VLKVIDFIPNNESYQNYVDVSPDSYTEILLIMLLIFLLQYIHAPQRYDVYRFNNLYQTINEVSF